MAYESLRAMGIFLLKIIGFNKMESGKCVHILNSDLVDRARVYAKSKNMTLKHFVEGLIYEASSKIDCGYCINSFCPQVGQSKSIKYCVDYKKQLNRS